MSFRYVQSALILSVTPANTLHLCYDQFLSKRSHFESLFSDQGEDEEAVLPSWWPNDWWKETLRIVAEHHQRCRVDKKSNSLFAVHPALVVCSIKPLFKLVSVELEEANTETGRQMIRVHLNMIGERKFSAK